MTSLEKIKITHEFRQVCDIFNLSPDQIIQEFINNVSIADYMVNPFSPHRWANTFVLESVIANVESEEIMIKYGEFADRLVKSVLTNPKNAEAISKKMLDEWHKAVLEDRIRDVMDNDNNQTNNQ
jgi:ferredoxin-fold anticodon binding domain-containing protein